MSEICRGPVMRCLLLVALAYTVMGTADLAALDKLEMPEVRYKGLKEGSLAGDSDPGYGPASASRTQLQRTYEQETKERSQAIAALQKAGKSVPQSMYDELEPGTRKDAMQTEKSIDMRISGEFKKLLPPKAKIPVAGIRRLIKAKANKIQGKIRDAKQSLLADMQRKWQETSKEKELLESERDLPKRERLQAEAIRAEENKLRVQEVEIGAVHKPATDQTGVNDDNKPIMVHASNNWVRSDETVRGERFRPRNGKFRKPFVPKVPVS